MSERGDNTLFIPSFYNKTLFIYQKKKYIVSRFLDKNQTFQ